jgi:hypothetical protein
MKLIFYTVFLLTLWAGFPLYAGDSPGDKPAGAPEILIQHNYVYPGEGLKLLPESAGAGSVTDFFREKCPGYSVEMLYEFPGNREIDWEELYFSLRSVSRLEEVWYFSEHAGKYRYMFPRAYVIESPRSKKRLPDYDDNTKFADAGIYAFLDDAELKDGRYQVEYHILPGSIQVSIQNATSLRRFIKVVDDGDFYVNFLFFENPETPGRLQVYIYAAYSLKNEFIVLKLLKSPYSTLAKRVYTIFSALIGDFHGADLPLEFPGYLRE